MADIRPFQGVRYNKALVKDMAAVICPPYDVITPEMQQEFYHRSEQNFIRLEHARELPQDTAEDNKYTRSAATLEQWLKQGVLEIDKAPAIYLHDHYFTYGGREYRRRGIIVRVRLEEWDKMVVRPHEGTLAEARGDRLNLLWACQADTSPILALFEDPGKQISSLLVAQERNEPVISLSNANGESHYVWAITDSDIISQICSNLTCQPLYIADGHHRYESALTHQREKLACADSSSGDEPFSFVMMTLVDFSDPGLLILSPHRLVRGVSKSILEGLMTKLGSFFEMEELPFSTPDLWQKVDTILSDGAGGIRLILFGLAAERLVVLSLRDFSAASQMMPYFHSDIYKGLSVSVVDHIIMEKLLGLSSDKEGGSLAYSYDGQEAVNRVLDEEYQLAFLVGPVKVEVIKAIADTGDRMPRKSTYFYPKTSAGLVFYRLV
ncbi:DUF1015 domain-containing protein [Chloroflexota bacterium]